MKVNKTNLLLLGTDGTLIFARSTETGQLLYEDPEFLTQNPNITYGTREWQNAWINLLAETEHIINDIFWYVAQEELTMSDEAFQLATIDLLLGDTNDIEKRSI